MRCAIPLLSLLTLFACGDDDRVARDGGRDVGMRPDSGPIAESCGTRAQWVYLVDSNRQLIRFEPDSLSFHEIGVLDCDLGSSPFSMAVDRQATAWILYQDGRLHRASTSNAACSPTEFEPGQSGFEAFGMGFVGGEDSEELFVTGGALASVASGSSRLATIDVATLRLTPRGGTLPGWPELTGTGEGALWGFFPDTFPPSARRLDPASGEVLETFSLDALPSGAPQAWAWAFWGARYYIFLQGALDTSTQVYRFDPATGATERLVEDTGRRIVGAGVSTCAPTELI